LHAMTPLWADHVIYAVGDLDAAAKRFSERFGLASVPGGRHRGWGTANRIVPLGTSYLELVAVVDPEEAGASDFGRAVSDAVAQREQLVGWAVATEDIEPIARRLDLEVVAGSRTRPDGSTLSWRVAGLARAMEAGALPLFIQWDGPSEFHPGAAAARHRSRPLGIAWIELTADERQLREWLGESDLPLRIAAGPQSLSAVGIGTADGEVVVH
jgi:Glyoxalase-like domain